MATMHAAQFHGARDIRINTIAKPTPTSTQVLIDVEWCGICGTDLHEYTDGPIAIPTAENPHSFTGEAFPVTLGHEFCGRVTLAPQGSQLKVGQAVIVDPRYYCGNCLTCGKGFHNMCKTWGFVGLSGGGGGLSESVAVEARACYSLPEGADLRYAALVEPLAVARHALNSSGFAEWKDLSVLVLGGGPVGLAVAMDLRVHGARRIIVSEPSAVRRTHIAKYCDVALDPLETSVADECRRVTGGGGVDVVIDCAGAMPALRAGFDAVKHKGTYVNVAGWGTEPTVPMMFFQLKEVVFRATMSYDDEDFAEVVKDFVAGNYPGVEEMVTSRIHLQDVVERGFEQLIQNKDHHIKILVTPKESLIN